jgi:HAD superfamily hydrolase (TIGR01490 family)
MNLALFDLDNTLLHGDSDHAWGEFLVERGLVNSDVFRAKNDEFYGQYKAGTLDIHSYLNFALSAIAGKTTSEIAPLHDLFMQTKIESMIPDASWNLLEQHRNDLCVIVTATNHFVTAPIAQYLGVPHLIACDVEIIDGRYTGRAIGTPSFQAGKVVRVDAWLKGMGKTIGDFEQSFFYSDSLNDLPLLNVVNRPVAVDPDPTLRAHAKARGWPIISLRESAAAPSHLSFSSSSSD